MKVIKAGWAHSFAKMTKDEMLDMLNLWAEMFADDDAAVVGLTVKSMLNSDKYEYAPTIGQVKEKMRKLLAGAEMDATDAWNMVAKAICNSGYEAEKEFAKLPKPVQRIVGSPNQLRDWSQMDSDTVHSVVASNFQRAFRVRQESAREYQQLPDSVTALLREKGVKLLDDGGMG